MRWKSLPLDEILGVASTFSSSLQDGFDNVELGVRFFQDDMVSTKHWFRRSIIAAQLGDIDDIMDF